MQKIGKREKRNLSRIAWADVQLVWLFGLPFFDKRSDGGGGGELCKGDLECTFAQAAGHITSQAETHTHIQLQFGAKAIGKCKSFFEN